MIEWFAHLKLEISVFKSYDWLSFNLNFSKKMLLPFISLTKFSLKLWKNGEGWQYAIWVPW